MENLNELKGLIKRVLEERGVKLASSNQYKDIFTLSGTLNYENYGKHYNPFKEEWVEDIKIKDITLDVSETNRSKYCRCSTLIPRSPTSSGSWAQELA